MKSSKLYQHFDISRQLIFNLCVDSQPRCPNQWQIYGPEARSSSISSFSSSSSSFSFDKLVPMERVLGQ
jgi:hypothetical protein